MGDYNLSAEDANLAKVWYYDSADIIKYDINMMYKWAYQAVQSTNCLCLFKFHIFLYTY